MCRRFEEYVEDVFDKFKPRKRYDLTKVVEAPTTFVDYDPISYTV